MSVISQIQVPSGTTYDIKNSQTCYADCDTAAATQVKEVEVDNWIEEVGATITVYFSNGNTAADAELQVNSENSRPIYYDGVALTGSETLSYCILVFDGNGFQLFKNSSGGSSSVEEIVYSETEPTASTCKIWIDTSGN